MARELNRSYKSYNRRFFKGSLPDAKIQWSGNLPPDSIGWYVPGESPEDPGTILILRGLKSWHNLWRMTLLHEMCHVKHRNHPEEIKSREEGLGRHSQVWKKEMRRLASLGAFDAIW